MQLKYKKLVPEAQAPFKKYAPDAGWDFFCTSMEVKKHYVEYHTGIALEIPIGIVGLAFPRSSVVEKALMLKNSVGVIDATYRGEIIFKFHDTMRGVYSGEHTVYQVGERIGQMVFLNLSEISELVESDELSETDRGTGGFGHTGK